jgi:hypothetical protein
MATNDDVLHTQRIETRSVETHSYLTSLKHISWQAVFAGVVITLAVQILLSLLGAAIGMSTIDPLEGESPSAKAFSIGAALWWVVSFFLSLAIGGMVAAELSGFIDRMDGALHGLVTWATAMLVGVYLIGHLVGSALSGIGGLATATVKGAAHGAAVATAGTEGRDGTGINWDALKSEVQGMLAANANSPGSPDLADKVQAFLRNEQVSPEDRQQVVDLIASSGNISKEEAEQKLASWEQTYRDASVSVDQASGEAGEKAAVAGDKSAEALAHVSLWSFLAFVLGALAAALGGVAGSKCREDRLLKQRGVVA